MYLPAHSPLTPDSLIRRGEGQSITSALPALGLKDSYLIPLSINKIRHSDKAPSPELFLQHYVIGLPGQETFLNKAFRSPLGVRLAGAAQLHTLLSASCPRPDHHTPSLQHPVPSGGASGPRGGTCGGQRWWKACPRSSLHIHRAATFLQRGCSCCHTPPSHPRGQETLHALAVAALSPVFWVSSYSFMSNWPSDHLFLLALLTHRS